MTTVVDQAKLVLNTFALQFQNALKTAELVSWNKHSGQMEDRNRLTVSEQVGPRFTVTQTVNGVVDLTAGVQDMVYGSEQFTVNRTFGTSMGYADFEAVRDLSDAKKSLAIKNAATNLAEQIDAYVLRFAMLASNNWVGTPGNAVDDWDAVATAYTRLKEEGVEDTDMRAVLAFSDKQALGGYVLDASATFLSSMNGKVFTGGFDSPVAGIPVVYTQQIPTFTFGTRTNGAINGANQNVNYSAVCISGAPGQYLTQLIAVDGLGANATVRDGEVFTIAGVRAYDNRLQAALTHLQQFRVIGDHTATAGGAIAAMRIFPAIIVPGTGSGGDITTNTANATVDAIPADNAVVTWMGTASASVKPRAIIQKDSIVVDTVDLIMPATGQGMRQSLKKVPLSVRMWKDSVFNTGEHRVRFDVALTANTRDRRRLIRLNG